MEPHGDNEFTHEALMTRFEIRPILRCLCAIVGLTLIFGASAVSADNPAALAPTDERARDSFTKFAQSWMDKVRRMADEQRPTAQNASSGSRVTYRDYTDDFTVELRPTGHASAPYVGILRYQEQIFSCRNLAANDCTLSSQIPVTEIFRYQDGRWVY
jgi:hypothetical protein